MIRAKPEKVPPDLRRLAKETAQRLPPRLRECRVRHQSPSTPLQFRLPTEPGDLPLGIVSRIALRIEDCIAQIQFALNQLQRLFVPVRFERLARKPGKPSARIPRTSSTRPCSEHPGAAGIETWIEQFPVRQQTEFQRAITRKRIAPLLKEPAHRLTSEQANFHRARHLRHIVKVNLPGGGGIEIC